MALVFDVAQLVESRLAVRQARGRIPARHPTEVTPTELTSDEIRRRRGFSRCSFMKGCANAGMQGK